jgi:hypothetical protein
LFNAAVCKYHIDYVGSKDNYTGVSLSAVLRIIYAGILADRLRDWPISRKVLSIFRAGFVKGIKA